ncbi:ferritin-like domain-containing protein [Pedobacter aquatilis]|uniref:YciE/YciF ferroxidase family protein n=1 Tax=Pedobacter aquatilis TaxID=351343 RepID=UPI00293046CF|nr:ferritin-like domain-containing protein [Pedobacter aquatilis]
MKTKQPQKDSKFTNEGESLALSPLNELFKDSIADLYWAENHLVKSLPKMISAATAPTLQKAIEAHLLETKEHVARLEQIFELLGNKPIAKKCDAMEGITKEAEGIVEETPPGTSTRDVGIILASQKVEHYEIASYSGLIRLAETLGLSEVSAILHQTLAEEQLADEKLTSLAEEKLNQQASKEA